MGICLETFSEYKPFVIQNPELKSPSRIIHDPRCGLQRENSSANITAVIHGTASYELKTHELNLSFDSSVVAQAIRGTNSEDYKICIEEMETGDDSPLKLSKKQKNVPLT